MKRFFDFLLPERTHLKAVIAALVAIFLLSGVLAYLGYRSEMARARSEASQTEGWEQLAIHSLNERFRINSIGALKGVFYKSVEAGVRGASDDEIRRAIILDGFCYGCASTPRANAIHQVDLRSTTSQEIPSAVFTTLKNAQGLPLWDKAFLTGTFNVEVDNVLKSYAFMRDIRHGHNTAWLIEVPREFVQFAIDVTLDDVQAVPDKLARGKAMSQLFLIEAKDHGTRVATNNPHVTSLKPSTGAFPQVFFPSMAWSVMITPLGHQTLVQYTPGILTPRLLLAVMLLIGSVILMAIALVRREEELYRLRSDLISGVSHELRTPLAQIRMFAETLLLGRTRTESERRRSLEIIDQEAKRLSHFVDNMLQFAKGEGGRTKLAPEPTSFAVEVRRAVESFIPMCQARGVEVRTELEDGVTAPVDRAALRRIMLNLMENALKYGPDEQRITVGVALFGDVVRLWVDDEGEGIPRGDRERVFDSFYRLSRELDRRITGSGIGLAVVRQLATLHNGRAWAEEAPGGGARLVVEFPDAYVRPVEEGSGWAVA